MGIAQSSVPEVKEDAIGYALQERRLKAQQYQDLGPPDMVSMIKHPTNVHSTSATNGSTSNNTARKTNGSIPAIHEKGEIGTYFYTTGVDTSDPTAVAIFLKEIADTISEQPQLWFGKRRHFHVAQITFSTWNGFRHCDVNVEVHIPGTVKTYFTDSNGQELNLSDVESGEGESVPVLENIQDLIWAETFVTGLVRSLMLMKDNREDGEAQNVVETIVFNPFTSGKLEPISTHFINAFPLVYERGVLLDAPCYVQTPTRTNNYLVETLIELVRLVKCWESCVAMLEDLKESKGFEELNLVIARVLLACDQETKAVKLLHDELIRDIDNEYANPWYRAELLTLQADVLINIKRDYMLAKEVALTAADCSPSEFMPWFLLTKAYIKLNDIENALLCLNACPMGQPREKYVLKRVAPLPRDTSLHLPLPMDAVLEETSIVDLKEVQKELEASDPTLINLAAGNLKSTFQMVYRLLTEIDELVGWESLLKYRSQIFVMEDEYQGSTEELSKTESTEISQEPGFRNKRLCDRWLDNLFMLLYEDLKAHTLWQTEQFYFEAQNNSYTKLTCEWEKYGLCARRLGLYPEAGLAFQKGLSQRFSPECARKLLEYYVMEHQRIETQSLSENTEMKSSEIISRINDLDSRIIDLSVKITCWNHRWYIEFSTQVLDSLAVAVQNMGITKVSNEIASRYPESVAKLMEENVLRFYRECTSGSYDN